MNDAASTEVNNMYLHRCVRACALKRAALSQIVDKQIDKYKKNRGRCCILNSIRTEFFLKYAYKYNLFFFIVRNLKKLKVHCLNYLYILHIIICRFIYNCMFCSGLYFKLKEKT